MTAEGAPCVEIGPHLWFSDDRHERTRAAALCADCPARDWCHAEGEAVRAAGHRLFGVWAGIDHGMKAGAPATAVPADPMFGCGTEAGEKRHQRAGEPVCEACREAAATARRERKALRAEGKPASLARPLAPCGTYAAWLRHRRRGEAACHACVDAQRAYQRARWERRETA